MCPAEHRYPVELQIWEGLRPQGVNWQSPVPPCDRCYTQCAGSHNLAQLGEPWSTVWSGNCLQITGLWSQKKTLLLISLYGSPGQQHLSVSQFYLMYPDNILQRSPNSSPLEGSEKSRQKELEDHYRQRKGKEQRPQNVPGRFTEETRVAEGVSGREEKDQGREKPWVWSWRSLEAPTRTRPSTVKMSNHGKIWTEECWNLISFLTGKSWD